MRQFSVFSATVLLCLTIAAPAVFAQPAERSALEASPGSECTGGT